MERTDHFTMNMTKCPRCGKPFKPEKIDFSWTRCCQTCRVRNFLDALELETPPALLDKYTKVPQLLDESRSLPRGVLKHSVKRP
jgi:hypothetical protein